LADFISGFGHWFEDVILTPENTDGIPFIHQIAIDNKRHHTHPREMINTPWYLTIATTLPFILVAWFLCAKFIGYSTWWVVTLILLTFANQVHKWQHMRSIDRPCVIQFLIAIGVVLGSKHLEHHTGQFNTHFCILTPWLNPALDYFKFWPRS